MFGEKDMIFLGAVLLLSGKGYFDAEDRNIEAAIDTSRKVFGKVFCEEETEQ